MAIPPDRYGRVTDAYGHVMSCYGYQCYQGPDGQLYVHGRGPRYGEDPAPSFAPPRVEMPVVPYHDSGLSVLLNPQPSVYPRIGWTWPSATRDVMDQIHQSAHGLDLAVKANVRDAVFLNAWDAWNEAWNDFYEKNAGRNVAKLFYTDELARTVEGYRVNLLNWHQDYARQRRPDGSPVPPAGAQPPVRPTPEDPARRGFDIPWWAWALGGTAVIGVGYLAYQRVRELRAKREVIEKKVLPGVLERYVPGFGGQLAEVASARDGTRRRSTRRERDCGCDRRGS